MILLLFWLATAQDQRRLYEEVEGYDTQIAALDAQVEGLRAKATEMRAQEAGHRAGLAEAEAALQARRDGTAQRMRTLYRIKRRGLARLLFDAESPVELRRRVRYLLAILRADERHTREFATALEQRETAAAKVAEDARVVEGLGADLEARRAELEAQREGRMALLREVRSRPEMAGRALRERAEATEALGASIRAVEASAPSVGAASDGGADFRALKGRLPAPVDGAVVRPFGTFTDPVSGATASNLGLDYRATMGAPFRAVAAGTVTRAGYVRGYGQVVVVQHGAFTTLYAHANGLRVAQGQAVQRGEVLGLVGNTGLLDDAEARLHFEVRYNGTPQDPSAWLAQ